MHDSKIYLQTSNIALGGCSSFMLADLFFFFYIIINVTIKITIYSGIDTLMILF